MKGKGRGSLGVRLIGVMVIAGLVFTSCAGNGGLDSLTDTTKGAVAGGAGAAALGAIIYHGNPLAGALIGAAAGALTGGVVGYFMDERKKDLEKALAPQINAGQITVQKLRDNAILVIMTKETAFAKGSTVVNQAFIPTLKTIATVVKTYGKTTIAVIGHPDSTGTVLERQTLADQRAEAVRTLFLGMSVPSALLTASGNASSPHLDGRVEVVIHPLISG